MDLTSHGDHYEPWKYERTYVLDFLKQRQQRTAFASYVDQVQMFILKGMFEFFFFYFLPILVDLAQRVRFSELRAWFEFMYCMSLFWDNVSNRKAVIRESLWLHPSQISQTFIFTLFFNFHWISGLLGGKIEQAKPKASLLWTLTSWKIWIYL